MTIWSADTCDCRIEYNERINWIKSHNNCRLHSDLRNQTHLNTVLAQNRRFNLAFGISPTEDQDELIELSKRVNVLRIRAEPTKNNPNFDEELPFEQSLSFFQNLRRVLRIG